jgi:hypothetical protein
MRPLYWCVYANVDLHGQSTVCIKYGCVYTNTSTNSLGLSHAAWRVNALRLLLRVLFVFKVDQDPRRVGSKRQLLSVACLLRLVVLTAACLLAAISLVF